MNEALESLLLWKRQDGGNSANNNNPNENPSASQETNLSNPAGTAATSSSTTESASTPSETSNNDEGSGGGGQNGSVVLPTASATSGIPTASATHSIDSSSSNDGVSTGALAGAIVGSIIGSALLTFVIAWFFFRRRQSTPQKSIDTESRSPGSFTGIAAGHHEKTGESFALSAIVPTPADDDTVRSKVLTLFDQASLHIDNYYPPTSSPPRLSQDNMNRIDRYDSDYLPAPLVTLLGKRGLQRQVITHALVKKLVEGIQARGTLLPAIFAATPHIEDDSSDSSLFAWRMLSGHLYRASNSSQDPAQTTARAEAADALATDFTQAFAPYSQSSFSEAERLNHLVNLAKLASDLGVWLSSQPCRFEFDWTESKEEPNVLPGIVKVCDEHGKRLGTPQVLVEAVAAKL